MNYKNFVKRWQEVIDLPPQTLGPMTPVYHRLTKRLKVMPWPILAFSALCMAFGLYFLLGGSIAFFVSLLQRGF